MSKKVYAVKNGREKNVIVDTWDECSELVSGYPKAVFKGFSSREEAEAWLFGKSRVYDGIPEDSLFGDGAYSSATNMAEAQVTDINGKQLVYKILPGRTHNFAELTAVGLAVTYAVKHGLNVHVYTDSSTVYRWIQNGRTTGTVRDAGMINRMIAKIKGLLADHPGITIHKWDTRKYGEIPADFGRK